MVWNEEGERQLSGIVNSDDRFRAAIGSSLPGSCRPWTTS